MNRSIVSDMRKAFTMRRRKLSGLQAVPKYIEFFCGEVVALIP
jgi:hypothetical protein